MRIFLGGAHRLLGIDIGGSLFHQCDDVAHAEDAAGDTGSVELLDSIELFAGADQLDRLASDRTHGKRGAAAAIAINAGQNNAGKTHAFVE